MNKIRIVYYTGTGGTKVISEILNSKLINKYYNVMIERLGYTYIMNTEFYDLTILLFPVHAANAPHIVYKWIKNLPKGNKNKFAVISVSAGGEVIINRAARLSSIKLLEKKNYEVVYENSLIMPSNLFIPTPVDLSQRLINILPKKIDFIIEDLENKKVRRVNPPLIDRVISKVCELEKLGAKILGKTIKSDENCNGCRLCEKTCSCENIVMKNKKPHFGFNCSFCTACFYTCPKKSLSPKIFKSVLLKSGYRIEELTDDNTNNYLISNDEVIELTQSILWRGLRDYILNVKK